MPAPPRWVPLVLGLLALAQGLLYAGLTPPWQGPDELPHFEYAHLLAVQGRPLTPADASPALEQALAASLLEHRAWAYAGRAVPQPPPTRLADTYFFGPTRTLARFSLAYVPYALAVRPFLNHPVAFQLYAMRLVSVLMGAAVVVLAFLTARRLEPAAPALAYASAAVILLLPQHTFLLATVNDGHLAELLASVTLYQLVGLQRLGVTPRRALLAGLAAAGAVLSKTTAYFLVPLIGVWLLDQAGRWRGRVAAGPALVAVVVSVAFGAAVPLVVLPLVSTQPLAMLREVLSEAAAPGGLAVHLTYVAVTGLLRRAVLSAFMSFWAAFGWLRAPLPGWAYVIIGLACLAAAGGWARQWRARRAVAPGYSLLALAGGLSVLVMFGWFLVSSLGIGAYQGRYLFGALVPAALLLARGWLWVLAPLPERAALALIVGAVGLLQAYALFGVFLPFFYR